MVPFPTTSPFRIDQVTAAPLGMTLLFGLMMTTAGAISWAALQDRRRLWELFAGLLLAEVAVFFTLASWGNSDTTKLSYSLAFERHNLRGEPFWMAVAPLILALPYRMSAAHGLVSAGFASVGIFLARRWQAAGWAGWWALLLCCNPLLRNFLQNGVTRQALLTLLLLPLFLRAAGVLNCGWVPTVVATLWAATTHKTFLPTLFLSLLPLLARGWAFLPSLGGASQISDPLLSGWGLSFRRRPGTVLVFLLAATALIVIAALPAQLVLEKFMVYALKESYHNRYPLAVSVTRVQMAMVVGVLIACWQRRLGWNELRNCPLSRCLALYVLLFLGIQASVANGWIPQLIGRFADPVGFFLLILWLAWLQRHGCLWAAVPALVITLEGWIVQDLLGFQSLRCGSDDDFLCIPDRWPWLVRYGSPP